MEYSNEFIEKLDEFIAACDSNEEFMRKKDSNDEPPLSKEEEAALDAWITAGDPKVMEFLTRFVNSNFI
jgi:hypothetical protein